MAVKNLLCKGERFLVVLSESFKLGNIFGEEFVGDIRVEF